MKQKLFLVALLVLAVAWPFMVSRGRWISPPDHDLYYPRPRVERGCRPFGLLVLGYGGLLRHRRVTFALLNHYYGLGFWTCLPIAGLMAAAAGFLLGFPVLRLRGDYLAIVTSGSAKSCAFCCSIIPKLPADRTASARSETDALRTRVQPYRPRRRLGHVQQFLWPEIRSLRSRHLPLPGGVAAGGAQPVCHQPPAADAAGAGVGSVA